MSASRIAVALTAAFFASTASVWPGPGPDAKHAPARAEAGAVTMLPGARGAAPAQAEVAWPPASMKATDEATDVTARLELTATGAHRLVVDKKGAFVHVRYREVVAAGPDWAAIELRSPERAPRAPAAKAGAPGASAGARGGAQRAPEGDVAIWESTDPATLVTSRGLVRFSLADGARPEVTAAEAPRPGPRNTSPVRACQGHDDGESGFAVVCRITLETSGVRAIRPASAKPLAGAWVWEVPRAGKTAGARFVRIDLPLSPGGAEAGAIAYVHGARGVVVRAEATWPARDEAPALLFTETSRNQPTSPFFNWAPPPRPAVRR